MFGGFVGGSDLIAGQSSFGNNDFKQVLLVALDQSNVHIEIMISPPSRTAFEGCQVLATLLKSVHIMTMGLRSGLQKMDFFFLLKP